MTTALTAANGADLVERVVINGDLSRLTPVERVSYYSQVCESLKLNPLTKPFDYITLNGKLTLYARKDCADQLRNRDSISIAIVARELVEGVYVVTARATTPTGRTDESIGAVPIEGLKGEAKANAMMKAETKGKRRVTLSICGLGMLDETEIAAIPDARRVVIDQQTGEIIDQPASTSPPATPKQRNYIAGLQDDMGWHSEALIDFAKEQGVDDLVTMTSAQASALIEAMKQEYERPAPPPPSNGKPSARAALEARLEQTIKEARDLGIDIADADQIAGESDAALIAAGKKLRAAIEEAKQPRQMEEVDLPL